MLLGESLVNGPASGLPSPDEVLVWLTRWGLPFTGRPPHLGKPGSAELKCSAVL